MSEAQLHAPATAQLHTAQLHKAAPHRLFRTEEADDPHGREHVLRQITPFSKVAPALREELRQNPSVAHAPRSHKTVARMSPEEARALLRPKKSLNNPLERMDTPEYRQFNREFWTEAFRLERRSLEDLSAYRIRAVYRISRHMAEIRNMCGHDEALSSALETRDGIDPFTIPKWPKEIQLYGHLGIAYEKLLTKAFMIPQEQLAWCLNPDPDPEAKKEAPIIHAPGVPLIPPHVPLNFLLTDEEGNVTVDPLYNCLRDETLQAFLEEVRIICDYLRIGEGTEKDTNAGYFGLLGILDSDMVRLTWPTKSELLAFELLLVQETMNALIKRGVRGTITLLSEEYGLTWKECDGVVRMARRLAKSLTEESMEETRGIAILRLEHYISRAVANMDLKAEMNANKQLAMITGLTRADVDNEKKDFLDVVKRVSAKAARKATEKVLGTNNQKTIASSEGKK